MKQPLLQFRVIWNISMTASTLGFMTTTFLGGQAILVLVSGGVTWILATGLVKLIDDVDEVEANEHQLKTV